MRRGKEQKEEKWENRKRGQEVTKGEERRRN
jgi:hypothetical protein